MRNSPVIDGLTAIKQLKDVLFVNAMCSRDTSVITEFSEPLASGCCPSVRHPSSAALRVRIKYNIPQK